MAQPDKDQKVGLALGGGAVLGAAHIGVLKALEELEIRIDCISGTSIGALVSSLYAFGKNCDLVQDFAIDLSWSDITKISFSKLGLLSNNKMRDAIEKNIGDVTFEQSKIPLAIVATNISTGEKVVLKKGNVAEAVMASTCIPGIFKPISINEDLLVDGGIVENVPISPLKDLGANFTIAVDLNANYIHKRPENMIDLLLNSFHLTLSTASRIQTEDADILIKPDLSSFNMVDMNQIDELIDIGYEETMKVLKGDSEQ